MPNDIQILSASAGSGKTHSLTQRLAQLIGEGVRPEGVVATTFTRKAATELVSRVRTWLLKSGRPEEARRIRQGYIGTVNSVCGSILKDFAFEAELSPALEVLPGGEDAVVFRAAISEVIRSNAQRLAAVSAALDMEGDWGVLIKEIADKARVNGIDRAGLMQCIVPSSETLDELLPPPLSDEQGRDLDQELAHELDVAIGALPLVGDNTKATLEARNALLRARGGMREGRLATWATWVRLAGVSPGKKSDSAVEALRELASQVLSHPKFQSDLHEAITLFFTCAADALNDYQQHKKDHGLIDFIDQEMKTLELLKGGEVKRRLKERLDLLLVDEFQDTSPIQLALFLRLADTAGRSIWVGDQKQSIFAFRGADPELMGAVMDRIGNVQVLSENWRSQPALVNFASNFFAKAMARHGIPEQHVRLAPKVAALPSPMPNLKCWWLDCKSKEQDWNALAGGVKAALSNPKQYPVLDKRSGKRRNLKAGDIAILCLQGAECQELAAALELAGVKAATSAPGLMSQPETVLALAAFRVLIDEDDLLAIAEMARLFALDGKPTWWLEYVQKGDLAEVKRQMPAIERLAARRSDLMHLTVTEALDLALELAGVRRAVHGWDNHERRLANLDALRGFASAYEDICSARRVPCTPIGLLHYLDTLAVDEEDGQAECVGQDAVQIMTYHKSKGLEWPLVVLTGLNSSARHSVFGVTVVSPQGDVDLDDPLSGRWLRYWPWPFGPLKGFDKLTAAVEKSAAQAQAREQAERERLRLLYVGMTRARDHMIFAARHPATAKKSTTGWLDICVDGDGVPVITLPAEEGLHELTIGEATCPISVSVLQASGVSSTASHDGVWVPAPPEAAEEHPAARFAPGSESCGGAVVAEIVSLGEPIQISSAEDSMRLGSAVHACLAAVPMHGTREDRQARIGQILTDWGISALSVDAVCEMQDRLAGFVRERYPEAACHLEWPVHLRRGERRGSGWVDMLLRQSSGNVIIDHKTGVGDPERLHAKAIGYAGQFATYSEALAKSTGRPTLAMWAHFPLAGSMIRLELP